MARTLIVFAIATLLLGGGAYFFFNMKDDNGANGTASVPFAAPRTASAASVAPAENQAQAQAPAEIEMRGNYGEWSARCIKGSEVCDVFQRLNIKESGARILEFVVSKKADDADQTVVAQAALILPLGILLTAPVTLAIDKTESGNVPVRTCSQQGCIATFNITADVMDKMKKSKAIDVTFTAVSGERMTIGVSLNGFAEAVATLK